MFSITVKAVKRKTIYPREQVFRIFSRGKYITSWLIMVEETTSASLSRASMEITGFVAIGNGESCPYCDLIQGKDFEDAMLHLLKNHEKELSDALNGKTNDEVAGIVENECFFCKKKRRS